MSSSRKNDKIVVSRIVRHSSGDWPSSACSSCSEKHWQQVALGFNLNDPIKVEDFIIRLRATLSTTENRQISATRYGGASYDTLKGGYDLDTASKVESFLVDLRAQLLSFGRETLFGESDEYRAEYGYRVHNGQKYDGVTFDPFAAIGMKDFKWLPGFEYTVETSITVDGNAEPTPTAVRVNSKRSGY